MGLFHIIYQSQALVPFQPPELTAMLAHSCAHNARHHITGLLLYTPDGRFLQVLEGPASVVSGLYQHHIAVDPRHVNCRPLGVGPGEARSFPAWPMGFRHAQAQDLRVLLAPVPVPNAALLVPRPHTRSELLALLREFVANSETPAAKQHPW